MIRINLLPVREAKRKAGLRQQVVLMLCAVVVGVVICGGMHVTVAAKIAGEQARITEAQGELDKLKKTLKAVKKYRTEKRSIEKKLAVISRLDSRRQGPVKLLDEIASRIPERMWLTSLKMGNDRVEMTGFGHDNEVIAAFLTSLEQSKLIGKVELEKSQLKEKKGLKLNEFKIKAARASFGDKSKAKKSKKKRSKKKRR